MAGNIWIGTTEQWILDQKMIDCAPVLQEYNKHAFDTMFNAGFWTGAVAVVLAVGCFFLGRWALAKYQGYKS